MVGTAGFEPATPTPPSVVRYQAALRSVIKIKLFKKTTILSLKHSRHFLKSVYLNAFRYHEEAQGF